MRETSQTPKLRSRLEMINSSSRVKLKADPTPDMIAIHVIAEHCVRHHETLAIDVWRSSIRQIREALENIEDIYESAEEDSRE